MRNLLDWKIQNETWRLGPRTLLIGTVCLAPDAPAEPHYTDPGAAAERALELAAEGADFIELDTVSWHAGAAPVEEAEELRRLIPVLKRLKGEIALPLIVETCRSAVAGKAIEHGATVLRDPTGLVLEPALARLAVQHDTGLVLVHARGTPAGWAKLPNIADPIGTVIQELDAAVGRARSAGVDRARLAVDPGFGMGKRKEHNSSLLKHLHRLVEAGLPVVAGTDGKHFASEIASDPNEAASLAAAVMALRAGVQILRSSSIRLYRHAVLVADYIMLDEKPPRPAAAAKPKPEVLHRPVFADQRPKGPVRPKLRPRTN